MGPIGKVARKLAYMNEDQKFYDNVMEDFFHEFSALHDYMFYSKKEYEERLKKMLWYLDVLEYDELEELDVRRQIKDMVTSKWRFLLPVRVASLELLDMYISQEFGR